jgi:hypothetical protein
MSKKAPNPDPPPIGNKPPPPPAPPVKIVHKSTKITHCAGDTLNIEINFKYPKYDAG